MQDDHQDSALKQRAAEIGDHALDVDAGPDRDAYIEKHCCHDQALKSLVQTYVERAESSHPLFGEVVDDELEDPLIGRIIGKWKPIRRLGEGGFGVVYLVERVDGQVRQLGAMKFLQGTVRDHDIDLRFRDERQILANMKHEYIVGLIDAGITDEEQPYFVMEFIEEAESIVDYCRKHDLSVRDCLGLFRRVCEAVAYAHRKGAFHRDLKPENILVTKDKDAEPRDGKPHLLDFGLAKILDPAHRSDSRAANSIHVQVGTPRYSSPEQISGEPVDATTDVYSLAVILYEILAGTDPYDIDRRLAERANKWVAQIISTVDPESPSRAVLRPNSIYRAGQNEKWGAESGEVTGQPSPEQRRRGKELAGDLDAIVLMALRKKRERRYASVGEFNQDIERYLLSKPVLAQPDSRSYRLRKFIKRFRWQIVGASALLLFLISVAAFAALNAHQQGIIARQQADFGREQQKSLRKQEALTKQVESALRTERNANQDKDRALQAETEAAFRARRAQREAEKQRVLAEDRTLSVEASLVTERLRLEPVAGLSLAVMTAEHSLRQFHRLTPDVLKSVKAALDSSLEQTILSLGSFTVRTLMFSPDDTALLGASGLRRPAYTYRWQLDGKRVRDVQQEFPYPTPMSPEDLIVLSPMGDQVFSGDSFGNLALWDRGRGFLRDPWKAHDGPITALGFSADGKLMASAGQDKIIRIWDGGGKALAASQGNATLVTAMAFSPDRSHSFLVAGGQDGMVRVWKTADGTPVGQPLRGHQDAVRAVQVNQHMAIASGGDDRTIRLWTPTSDIEGKYNWSDLAPLVGHATSITALAFSADGRQLASGSRDGTIRLWDDRGHENSVLKGHHAPITALAFSHSGRLLASAADQFPDFDNTVSAFGISKVR